MTRKPIAALLPLALLLAACTATQGAPEWTDLVITPPTAAPTGAASGEPSDSPQPPSGDPGPVGTTPVASGGGGETTQITVGTDTAAELRFDPTSVTAPAGSTVELTFENRSIVPHNLTFGDPINTGTQPIVDPGASETIELTAPAPGDYQFVCTLHPGMEGTLTVE